MNDEILSRVKAATDELVDLLSSLSETELNIRPFEGSWTAAQVGEHLLKSYGVGRILEAPVEPTERDPNEKVLLIKEMMLNFDTKMNAPAFIVPSNDAIDKTILLNSLRDASAAILRIAGHLDLLDTCTGFALPEMGEFTRSEWLHFILYHTKRHNRQLKNIRQKLTERAPLQGNERL
jgi:hypothetical protein